jgi:hypothetical protein
MKTYPPAWLPNREGFQFTAILKDGRQVPCSVVRRENGNHTVSGAVYTDIASWFAPPGVKWWMQ